MGAINWSAINQKTLGQLVPELCDASRCSRLKLPASLRSVNQQFIQLVETERRLLQLRQRLMGLSRYSFNPAERQAYSALFCLVQDMERLVKSLKLLAEEYPLDPDGAAACLATVQAQETGCLQQLDVLKGLAR